MSAMRIKLVPKNIKGFSSYLTENTLDLSYKDHLVKAVYRDSCYLLLEASCRRR